MVHRYICAHQSGRNMGGQACYAHSAATNPQITSTTRITAVHLVALASPSRTCPLKRLKAWFCVPLTTNFKPPTGKQQPPHAHHQGHPPTHPPMGPPTNRTRWPRSSTSQDDSDAGFVGALAGRTHPKVWRTLGSTWVMTDYVDAGWQRGDHQPTKAVTIYVGHRQESKLCIHSSLALQTRKSALTT